MYQFVFKIQKLPPVTCSHTAKRAAGKGPTMVAPCPLLMRVEYPAAVGGTTASDSAMLSAPVRVVVTNGCNDASQVRYYGERKKRDKREKTQGEMRDDCISLSLTLHLSISLFLSVCLSLSLSSSPLSSPIFRSRCVLSPSKRQPETPFPVSKAKRQVSHPVPPACASPPAITAVAPPRSLPSHGVVWRAVV